MTNPNRTRYIVLIGDGMADYPLTELGGKTPLEAAATPNMDRIAACRVGRVRTIPAGMEPGSDVANLSLLGYDPAVYHTGRAPLEAGSMGVKLAPSDVAFRMNLVCLDFKSEKEIIMISHSSGDITSPEAAELVHALQDEMQTPSLRMYPGIAYRHLLLWENGPQDVEAIPPHDVLDQNMASYLNPVSDNPISPLVRRSWDILEGHPVNRKRLLDGRKVANSIWLWGQGKAPSLPLFKQEHGLTGGVISAVDLLKGIGFYAGFESIPVEGATGYLDTNYRGKAEKALEALNRLDFMFVHVEAPDEAGHNGNIREKIQAIEAFDSLVVGTVLDGLAGFEAYRIMVASDHFTPISKKTHTPEPAPFAWAAKEEIETGGCSKVVFTEKTALDSGLSLDAGADLMASFLS